MSRVRGLALIMIFFLLVTIGGLVFVQVVMHERYSAMSEDNRLKIVPLSAPRGNIYDRNGYDMVKDELSFNVSLKYVRKQDNDDLIKDLSSVLGIEEEALKKKFIDARKQPFVSHLVARDVGMEKAIRVAEMGTDHPALLLEVIPKRRYLMGRSASNFLGYVGLINRKEFQTLKPYGFRMNDLMGRSGLEKYYDDYLRGKHGGKQVEVDNRGREVTVLGLKEPLPGNPLQLTVDARLQEFCDSLLEGRKGAIVAMSPEPGEIYALASSPSYDPNVFVGPGTGSEVLEVLNDGGHPLLNRALVGAYPPGSIFKLVVAVAALETEVISTGTSFNCSGKIVVGGRPFHCWRKTGHGDLKIKEAIKVSCNVFFWRTGLALGPGRIAEYAAKMGLGELSGIDLPFEVDGLLPSESWKRKVKKEPWYRGETMNYSVGQGYLLCTPLQIARMVSVLANKGYLVKPYIVDNIDGLSVAKREKISLGISKTTIDIVREGMKKVVNDKRGTGKYARQKNLIVSGKTGTAQTSREEDHGWFAGFAPFDKAKLTVVVFDEYGGQGGRFSAKSAGKIFQKAKEIGII